MDKINISIGAKLHAGRVSNDLEARKVAALANILPTRLGQIENGIVTPTFEEVYMLCRIFDLQLHEVAGDEAFNDLKSQELTPESVERFRRNDQNLERLWKLMSNKWL